MNECKVLNSFVNILFNSSLNRSLSLLHILREILQNRSRFHQPKFDETDVIQVISNDRSYDHEKGSSWQRRGLIGNCWLEEHPCLLTFITIGVLN
jgi:hypothetical protein